MNALDTLSASVDSLMNTVDALIEERDAALLRAERMEKERDGLREAVEWILSGDADLTDFKKFCAELRRRAYGEGNNL